MFNLAVIIIATVSIVLLYVAFKAVGEGTRSARFIQGVIGVAALVIGSFGISLIF